MTTGELWKPGTVPRDVQRGYECVLEAMSALHRAAAQLPADHPAHQELDQARLAVKVTLDVIAP